MSEMWRDRCNAGERPTVHIGNRDTRISGKAIIGNDDVELNLRNVSFDLAFDIARMIAEREG